jgi:hypothetical protein
VKKRCAQARPVIPAGNQSTSRGAKLSAPRFILSQVDNRFRNLFVCVGDQNILVTSHCQSLSAKRSGYDRNPGRHRFEDFETAATANVERHHGRDGVTIKGTYIVNGPRDFDAWKLRQLANLSRGILADNGKDQFRPPFLHARPDVAREVHRAIDVGVIIHRADEDDPICG